MRNYVRNFYARTEVWNRTFDQQLIYIYTPGKLPSMHINVSKCFLTLLQSTDIGRLENWWVTDSRKAKFSVFILERVTTSEILMKPRLQCSTQFSWPSHTSLAWLWKMSWLTLLGWRVFDIGSKNHDNYTCRNYIFCLNLAFEIVWKLFYLYEVLENLTPKIKW